MDEKKRKVLDEKYEDENQAKRDNEENTDYFRKEKAITERVKFFFVIEKLFYFIYQFFLAKTNQCDEC